MVRVSVIILNWNGWRDTVECLESLLRVDYSDFDIVIVDNGSSDGSVGYIKRFCQDRGIRVFEVDEEDARMGRFKWKVYEKVGRGVIIVKNRKNYGFSGGNNVGIAFALKVLRPKYVMTLNNDTVVDPDFLIQLIRVMEKDERIGCAQALLLRPDGKTVDSLGQRLMKLGAKDDGMGKPYRGIEGVREIFGCCAAATVYRSDMLRKIGLFDERFFIIYEDVDLCWRMRIRGYKAVLVPEAVVYHKRGVSGKRIDILNLYYSSKNIIILYLKYYPLWNLIKDPLVLLSFLRFLIIAMLTAAATNRTSDLISGISAGILSRSNIPSVVEEIWNKWLL